MPSLEQLNEKFAILNLARFERGRGGLPRLAVTSPLSQGHIYLHGAHITHFQPAGQPPVLFLSDKSLFADGKAIRGGVPVIFPWFGPRNGDKTQMHGLARTRPWEVREVERLADGGVRAVLALDSDDQTRAIWANDFELELAVSFQRSMTMALTVRNTSANDWKFEEALHTYYAVGDIQQVSVDGLGGSTYVEKFIGPGHRRQDAAALAPAGPTDRVYLGTSAACTIHDRANHRRIVVSKTDSRSTVVWNPWSDAIGNFTDLEPADWKRFLCVETCNVWDEAPALEPGGIHSMRAAIEVESE